jgi:hypothetical protein
MAKKSNSVLHKAKVRKNDEFYTRLTDVEKELKYYWNYFRGASILCNCDDPGHSQFFRYFKSQFEFLGLKKLVAVGYKVNNTTDTAPQPAYMEYYGKDSPENSTEFTGSGDFRSPESLALLEQADIVVTNPPFSLFREYIAQLIEYDKKFLLIGNLNSVGCRDIFKLFMARKIWFGVTLRTRGIVFNLPGHSGDVEKQTSMGNVRWFTNLDNPKLHEKLILWETYTPERFPTYENYDAIEVSKVAEIPKDYYGVMGVPVSFLDKYNPDQFEILGMCENEDLYGLKTRIYTTKECKQAYFDKFGKNGTYGLNASGVLIRNGRRDKVFQRILIRRKQK